MADLVSRIGWRLLLIGCLAAGVVAAAKSQHWAAALVLAVAVALTCLDIRRTNQAARPSPSYGSSEQLARRLDEALALLDAVTIALLVVKADGHVRFSNRAGRTMAAMDPGTLPDILGEPNARRVLALPLGGRQLLTLDDGRALLVWTAALSTPGSAPTRLVSLQQVSGELDAVQVGAWHMMTRVLAHEMMNSLTPIASLAESLATLVDQPDSRLAPAVATIGRRSRQLMTFVERYRAIVDLPQPQRSTIRLAPFLAQLQRLVASELVAREVSLDVDLLEPDLHIAADPALLEQAMINLIKNAVDAASSRPPGQVHIAASRNSKELVLTVSDNGPGVMEVPLEELFVPFFTTKPEGAGVGLTLARQIALAHGGRLSARALEPGMAFDLTLPAND